MTMDIELTTQKDRALMESVHTCDGSDISPEISWTGIPESAKSLILLMEDPDAPLGTFFHWGIYNIRTDQTGLPGNIPKLESTQNGNSQGINGFRKIGYGGPCPPGRKAHRYVFTLYATSHEPTLKPGLTRKELRKILEDDTIEQASVTIKYTRER